MKNKKLKEKELTGLEQSVHLFGKDEMLHRVKRWEKRVDKQFSKVIVDFSYGGLYARKILEPKVRQLCAISVLTAMNALPSLRVHIKAAFRIGISETEVKEAIIQTAQYCGLPYVNQAFGVYEEVVKEDGACRGGG